MQIDQLHITHIYQGILACDNIRKFNEHYLSGIEDHARIYLPDDAPLHIIIPSTVPDVLSHYMISILLNGTPDGRENERNENGKLYNWHWLGVVAFIDDVTVSHIQEAIKQAKIAFTDHAQGYFF